ncbi:transcription antitermination factor NusB [Olsenella sp. AF16-14LB]|uniref:transcription antitermination factor NusB n=1 Tax=Atopobiaceae TaxID=1643824 RepID=UPI000E44D725|nr:MULTISPECIES: transcription antitermination factor NusB [unclassified Olsenella]RGJ47801.1 transcription antitermination factor NusB [Olsenella sp. TM06-36]RGS50450.1 transcription antitermination factor NusB [Olsenella sp. AF21-51]RGU50551.1 transcription antitermination factor NusB [Olsenella sp. AF16-14LB]RGU82008.1 transcription antitermination factor NusB [Olsenella sp. AF15-43LB]RHB57486.1 transcription antitermination factor NusB [Olsenella sp. AM39-30AC]
MSGRFGGRTLARAQALQLLFQADVNNRTVEEVLSGDYAISDGPLDPYGQELALGVDSRRYAIDAVIRASSASWSLSRMPVVDRNILRLALYEMIEEDDITVAVAIDEAVELAKAFGTDESPRFINGVLGSIAADVNAGVDVYEKARQVLHAATKSQADEATDETDEAFAADERDEEPLTEAPAAADAVDDAPVADDTAE